MSIGALVACQTQTKPEETQELGARGIPTSMGDAAEPMVDPDDASARDDLNV